MKTLICNSFSLNMVAAEDLPRVRIRALSLVEARYITHHATDLESTVGHMDIASIMSHQLGIDVPVNRTTVTLLPGQRLIVGQYTGPRLPEGATTLPNGAAMQWIRVTVDGTAGLPDDALIAAADRAAGETDHHPSECDGYCTH